MCIRILLEMIYEIIKYKELLQLKQFLIHLCTPKLIIILYNKICFIPTFQLV